MKSQDWSDLKAFAKAIKVAVKRDTEKMILPSTKVLKLFQV
jgi:imidazoleglycerol phosphate dehydratase HisB